MPKPRIAFASAVLAGLIFATAVRAQETALTLSLSRDWGYGGFGGDIQGTFSLHASGPSSIVLVEFFLDGTKIGEDDQAPFALQFVTDNYPLGDHELYAVGHAADGSSLRSNSIRRTFVSASEGGQAAWKIILPLLVVVFVAIGLAAAIPLLTGRKQNRLAPGAKRSYALGGGICPRCKRPFGFSLFGINLLVGKFARCPHCGRWGVVRAASLPELQAAEQAEVEASKETIPETSAEEKLKKDLEDSKYQEL
jgi:hypothetical protein